MIRTGLALTVFLCALTPTISAAESLEFRSVQEAVVEATRRHNPESVREDREYLGGVYEQSVDGTPRYGYTVAAGHAHRDEITVSIRLPRGARLVAIWHTHGAYHWSRQYFSATDTSLAAETDLPVYLATPEGELRVFHPGDRVLGRVQARRLGLGNHGGAARGQLLSRSIPTSNS
ncbi:MAG: DUF4329 domain-containing protein [Pseudomonadota bacterium]